MTDYDVADTEPLSFWALAFAVVVFLCLAPLLLAACISEGDQ